MDSWAAVILVFVLVSGIVLLVVVLTSGRGKGRLTLPGRASLEIEFDRGWQLPPSTRDRGKKPVGSQPHFWLEAKGAGGKRWQYLLDGRSQVYIGRRDDNDIVLQDRQADSRHAVIHWEQGRYKINNLSPRVPTRVNGRPITKQNLGSGNTIQMGRTKLIFREKCRSE